MTQLFYLPHLRLRCSGAERVHSFICRGKPGVLDVYRNILFKNGRQRRVLFFVDSDLELFLAEATIADSCIYKTDYYSIENFLVTSDVLEFVWTDLLALSAADERLARARHAFEQGLSCFSKNMITIMAWVVYHRRRGTKLNLQNLNLDNVFAGQT